MIPASPTPPQATDQQWAEQIAESVSAPLPKYAIAGLTDAIVKAFQAVRAEQAATDTARREQLEQALREAQDGFALLAKLAESVDDSRGANMRSISKRERLNIERAILGAADVT